jgi:hypothetical protein
MSLRPPAFLLIRTFRSTCPDYQDINAPHICVSAPRHECRQRIANAKRGRFRDSLTRSTERTFIHPGVGMHLALCMDDFQETICTHSNKAIPSSLL